MRTIISAMLHPRMAKSPNTSVWIPPTLFDLKSASRRPFPRFKNWTDFYSLFSLRPNFFQQRTQKIAMQGKFSLQLNSWMLQLLSISTISTGLSGISPAAEKHLTLEDLQSRYISLTSLFSFVFASSFSELMHEWGSLAYWHNSSPLSSSSARIHLHKSTSPSALHFSFLDLWKVGSVCGEIGKRNAFVSPYFAFYNGGLSG